MKSKVKEIPFKREKVREAPAGIAAFDSASFDESSTPDAPGLAANASGKLAEAAPTFGNILDSIGAAVVASQKALDEGIIETVESMADAKIQVATTVFQYLGDDGYPNAEATEVVTEELSLLDFTMPTVHEWKVVAVSMDLQAASTDTKSGITFNNGGINANFNLQKQSILGPASVPFVGSSWGADAGLMFNATSAETRTRTDWTRSQIKLDAELGKRTTTKLPDPVKITTGPVIIAQVNRTDKESDASRKAELKINLFKSTGEKMNTDQIHIESGALVPKSIESNADKTMLVIFERSKTLPEGTFPVTIKFGDLTKQIVMSV